MADCPCSYPRIDHVACWERTYPFRQIARRARAEAVPAFWKINKTHILATRGLVRDLSLVNWLAVIQSRLVVVKVHTVRVELNV